MLTGLVKSAFENATSTVTDGAAAPNGEVAGMKFVTSKPGDALLATGAPAFAVPSDSVLPEPSTTLIVARTKSPAGIWQIVAAGQVTAGSGILGPVGFATLTITGARPTSWNW